MCAMWTLSEGHRRPDVTQRILERNAVDGPKTCAGVPSWPRLVAGRSAPRVAYSIVDVAIDVGRRRIELRSEVANRFAKVRVDQRDKARVKRSRRAGSTHGAYAGAVLEQRVTAGAVGIAGDIGNRARLVPVIGGARNVGRALPRGEGKLRREEDVADAATGDPLLVVVVPDMLGEVETGNVGNACAAARRHQRVGSGIKYVSFLVAQAAVGPVIAGGHHDRHAHRRRLLEGGVDRLDRG